MVGGRRWRKYQERKVFYLIFEELMLVGGILWRLEIEKRMLPWTQPFGKKKKKKLQKKKYKKNTKKKREKFQSSKPSSFPRGRTLALLGALMMVALLMIMVSPLHRVPPLLSFATHAFDQSLFVGWKKIVRCFRNLETIRKFLFFKESLH